jgi:hypothetical protein
MPVATLNRSDRAGAEPGEYHRRLGPRGHRLLVRLSSRIPHRGTSRSVTTRVLILGAAGRDFHNFDMVYRDDPATQVVAFTRRRSPAPETVAIRRPSPDRATRAGRLPRPSD